MKSSHEEGFFLWEAMIVGICVLVMAGLAGLYVKAAELRAISAGQAAAMYLARAQISYAQSRLDRDGELPDNLEYQGEPGDLCQNGRQYQLHSSCRGDGDIWQIQVEVVWDEHGHEGQMVFARQLGRFKPLAAERDDPL